MRKGYKRRNSIKAHWGEVNPHTVEAKEIEERSNPLYDCQSCWRNGES